jgi:hypothetical protein
MLALSVSRISSARNGDGESHRGRGPQAGFGRRSGDEYPESEQEEHGDVLEGMYTSDMLDENGKPILARAQMSVELAEMAGKLGRAGGQAQVRGQGK